MTIWTWIFESLIIKDHGTRNDMEVPKRNVLVKQMRHVLSWIQTLKFIPALPQDLVKKMRATQRENGALMLNIFAV